MLLPPTCYLIKFGRPRSNHLGAGRIQKNCGRRGPRPRDGDVADPWKYAYPHLQLPNSVILGLTVRMYSYGDLPENVDPSRPRPSLEVTGTDMDRSATYDFLLVFHSNYGHLVPFSI